MEPIKIISAQAIAEPVIPSVKKRSRTGKLADAVTVGSNSMSAMEPFGALIGAAIGGVEALEEEGKNTGASST